MAKSLLDKLAHNRKFNKQTKSLKSTAPKQKKVRYNKTVQITEPVYNNLKLYSFKNDIAMASIVTRAVKAYLSSHNV